MSSMSVMCLLRFCERAQRIVTQRTCVHKGTLRPVHIMRRSQRACLRLYSRARVRRVIFLLLLGAERACHDRSGSAPPEVVVLGGG